MCAQNLTRESKMRTFQWLINQLNDQVNNIDDNRFNSLIGELCTSVKANNATLKLKADLPARKKKFKVAPNQNSVLQSKFKRCTIKSAMKAKPKMKKPTEEEKDRMLQ